MDAMHCTFPCTLPNCSHSNQLRVLQAERELDLLRAHLKSERELADRLIKALEKIADGPCCTCEPVRIAAFGCHHTIAREALADMDEREGRNR